jgi:carbon catabolite-derepressing protein kinase
MASTLDDEDLALSINPSHTRRNSTRTDEQHSQPAQIESQSLQDVHGPYIPSSAMPERLNQYTVLRTLGEGSFGKVKLATHKLTGQKVALKIINRKKLMARDMQGRMEREIQYLQLLRHPHIIKLSVSVYNIH